MTIDVEVTGAHIAAGERHDRLRCPLALAIRPTLVAAGWPADVIVSVSDRVVVLGDAWFRVIKIPALVRARIRRYDRGSVMRPFRFALELPDARATGGGA